ncbi:hypothetical protein QBC35DRAFT_469627 [Podospora australis]|uniref:Zn(2)-C6 fungal-type domain-containing protein n=1 Tax=Podospora australis TaxID=1536484 RepID=A0AAN6X355_9PEZI|nr:hypothetical protein QBC35DRAFT_469627 [Podospora australis]
MESLPTPPNEDILRAQSTKTSQQHHHKTVKPVSVPKSSKRASSHGHPNSPGHDSHGSHSQHGQHGQLLDQRHKRVWKACERCRMKKTKCDGEFPCKRCKDDGLVCTAGVRKKTEYKQLPRGYAEVLENTQFALIATIHKLYAMVRNGQPWDLGEPDLNDRGQPVIHTIASKLNCIRPNLDVDLPIHAAFPEDEHGLTELARELEDHHNRQANALNSNSSRQPETDSGISNRVQRASSSASEDSVLDHDYRKVAFGGGGGGGGAASNLTMSPAVTMSPASLSYPDFDVAAATTSSATPSERFAPAGASQHSPTITADYSWMTRPTSTMDFPPPPPPFLAPNESYLDVDMLNQGLLESNFGVIKPHVLNCPNPEVMMGMGDPMMYPGYDAETLRM